MQKLHLLLFAFSLASINTIFINTVFAQSATDSTTFSIHIINQSHRTIYFGNENSLDSIREQSDYNYEKRVIANYYPESMGIASDRSGVKQLAFIPFLYNYLANRTIIIDENENVHFQSDSLEEKLDSISSKVPQPETKELAEIIRKNGANLLAPKLICNSFLSTETDIDTITAYYTLLTGEIKKSVFGKKISDYIAGRKRFAEGNLVEDFSLPDSSAVVKNLYSIRSKYILVDFWFSNCGPCLASFPHLQIVYNSTSRSVFEIVGLSIDNEALTGLWRQTIKERNLCWINLLDSKTSISYHRYAIENYPTTILIGTNHKIIKINPSPDELLAIINK